MLSNTYYTILCSLSVIMHHVFKNYYTFYIWNLKASVAWPFLPHPLFWLVIVGKTQVLLITLGDQCDSEPSYTKPGVHFIKRIYQHCLDPDRKRWQCRVSPMFWIADTFVTIAEQFNGHVRFPNHGVCFDLEKYIEKLAHIGNRSLRAANLVKLAP